MTVPISTNSSLLLSLAFKSPVREGLFAEINHTWENELHSGRPVCIYPIKSIVYFTFRKFNQTVLLINDKELIILVEPRRKQLC